MAGFGGVAEYGITVRWNKNFLKIIRLLLERRREFAMFGGVRFGGTITIDSAFELGFDHIALCAGAGRPTVIPMNRPGAGSLAAANQVFNASPRDGTRRAAATAGAAIAGAGKRRCARRVLRGRRGATRTRMPAAPRRSAAS